MLCIRRKRILASDFQINMQNTTPNVTVSVALIVAFFHLHKFHSICIYIRSAHSALATRIILVHKQFTARQTICNKQS